MKNDINLLIKRKIKSYSGKNIAVLLLMMLLIGAIAYAGISLPSGARQVARIKAAEVDKKLASSTVNKKDIGEKTELKARLDMQISELNALKESKGDISGYIDAVERSRPSSIVISMFTTDSATTINLLGRADSDKTIAIFCLRLREQNVFSNVFLTYSTTDVGNKETTFAIVLTLPKPLDSEDIIQGLEQKDDVTTSTTPTGQENNQEAEQKDDAASNTAAAGEENNQGSEQKDDAASNTAAAGEENKQ
jgi:hypothetical protein